jgi:hypothetical protein
MAIKKSVRLTDKTCELLHKLTLKGETNWSGSINAMADQYRIFVNDNLPTLSDNEWAALYCTYNGYIPHPDIKQEIASLHWHISEGYQYDEQIRELIGSEENAVRLIERIKSWTNSQKLAVIFKARAYWRKDSV